MYDNKEEEEDEYEKRLYIISFYIYMYHFVYVYNNMIASNDPTTRIIQYIILVRVQIQMYYVLKYIKYMCIIKQERSFHVIKRINQVVSFKKTSFA